MMTAIENESNTYRNTGMRKEALEHDGGDSAGLATGWALKLINSTVTSLPLSNLRGEVDKNETNNGPKKNLITGEEEKVRRKSNFHKKKNKGNAGDDHHQQDRRSIYSRRGSRNADRRSIYSRRSSKGSEERRRSAYFRRSSREQRGSIMSRRCSIVSTASSSSRIIREASRKVINQVEAEEGLDYDDDQNNEKSRRVGRSSFFTKEGHLRIRVGRSKSLRISFSSRISNSSRSY